MNSKDHSESLFSHTNEAGALSYLVVNSELWFEYSDKLNKALFTRSEYKTIFGALSRLAKKTTAWDLTGIIAEIENDQKREQIDWQDLLTYLSAKTETIAAFPGHLNVLIELKQKRDCIEAAESLIYDIKNNKSSALDAIVKLPSKLCNIIQADENTNNWVLLSDLKQDKNSQMICKGLPTGYRKLDDLTNGLKPGQITIIAGRPALGKSALAHFIVVYLALHKKRNIAIFSLDIDTSTLKIRLWSLVSEIPYKIIENNQLNDEEKTKLEKAIEKISKSKIYINDEVPMDIDKLKASAYQKNSEIKLDLIVVDHGGRLYLAKDVRMPQDIFRKSYPGWEKFLRMREELKMKAKFNSIQSRRLGL